MYRHLMIGYSAVYLLILALSVAIAAIARSTVLSVSARATIRRFIGYSLVLYALVALLRTWISFRNYGQFVDLSYYESAVFQFAHGQLAKIWDIGSPLWSQHFEPILFLFVPLYWIGLGGGGMLAVVQAAAALLGALPLYAIAKLRTGSRSVALAVSAAYLFFGGLQSAYFYGFHPIVLFPLLFLLSVYWYERKQYGWYSVFLLLSLCVKEQVAFLAVAWGLWLLVGRKDRVWGAVTIAAGLAWYFISFPIIAYYHHGGYEYWGQFGGGASGGIVGIAQFAVTHPLQFVRQLVDDKNKLPMLIELFGSFGFLPLAAPLALIFLIPSLLLKLLSHDIAMLNSFHYSADIAPLLALATVEGARNLTRYRRIASMVAPYIFSVAILANICYGFAFYYGRYAMRFGTVTPEDFYVSAHSQRLDAVLATIPASASVSCEYPICSHIERPFWKKLPAPHGTTLDYVILDRILPLVLTDRDAMDKFVQEKIIPFYTRVIWDNDGIYLLKRK
jgi:uncharacterized membrane protein